MVDYASIIVLGLNSKKLEANPLLDFYDSINLTTGEIRTVNRNGNRITPYKVAFYNGLEFRIYDTGTVKIIGSLHKYYNLGLQNYNDFTFEAFLSVLKDIENKFGIKSNNCILKSVELGINIIPTIEVNHILNHCFLHKTKPFESCKNDKEGKYIQVRHSQYIIKIYNKGLQYSRKGFKIENEIIRFEIKYTKMERLNKLGVFNLNDIVELGFKFIEKELITEWQNVLFYDTTINVKSKRLVNYKNPLYWSELLQKPTNTNYYKQKTKLKEFTLESSDNIQNQLTEIMRGKIDFLKQKGASFDPLTIKSIHTPILKSTIIFCKVTGVDISMQKENSSLLSHTGLRYYFRNDKKIFEQIKSKFLSKLWHSSDFETQIKEIAHNIRNHISNQRFKQRRLYQHSQTNFLIQFGF